MSRRWILAALMLLAVAMGDYGRCTGPVSASPADNITDPPGISGGKFEVTCLYSHSAQVDPIVAPGNPMSAHLHDFFGNTTVDQNSTPAGLVGGPTTCKLSKDSAAYWTPAAYRSDTGGRVLPVKSFLYYFGTDGPTETHFPLDLEMLAGNPSATGPSEAGVIAFSCGNGGITNSPVRPAPYNCNTDPKVVNSQGVVAIVRFPFCWDTTGTGPGDVTYPDPATGDCPVSTLAQVQIHEHFGAGPGDPRFQRGDLLTFASGPWWTYHGDFMNGWDQPKLDALVDGCLNYPNLNCGFLTDADPGPGA